MVLKWETYMQTHQKEDRRLTDFDWEARKAAPVSKLIDPHVHYDDNPADLEVLFQVVDQYKVECITIISTTSPGKECIKALGAHGKIGERIFPYYRLNLCTGGADQVQRAYDLGFWGIKFITAKYAYDDPIYDPILRRGQELGMPCLFHTGVMSGSEERRVAGSGMSLMRADMLDTLAWRYPELLIQGAHLGNPDVATAFRACQYSPNLIWDASGGIRHLLIADPILLYASMNHLPQAWDYMMWSTDTVSGKFPPEFADGWPNQFEYQLALWQRILAGLPVKPTAEQLDKFFYGNARKWFDRIIEKRQK